MIPQFPRDKLKKARITPELPLDEFLRKLQDIGESRGLQKKACSASRPGKPHFYESGIESLTHGYCADCYLQLAYGHIRHDAGMPLFGGTRSGSGDDFSFEHAVRNYER
jgi:hypothetical protein